MLTFLRMVAFITFPSCIPVIYVPFGYLPNHPTVNLFPLLAVPGSRLTPFLHSLYPSIMISMVVLISKTMFSLLILLLNLKTRVCWLEYELTMIAVPLETTEPLTHRPQIRRGMSCWFSAPHI